MRHVIVALVVGLLLAGVCLAEDAPPVCELLEGTKDFDGLSDVVEVRLPDTVRTDTQVTVAGWVYPRVPKGAVTNRYIVAESYRLHLGMASNAKDAGPQDVTGPLTCALYTGNAGGGWSFKNVTSPDKLAADVWSHVAVTYDRKNLRLFLNGEEVAALAETGPLSQDRRTQKIAVGCLAHWWGNADFWAGLLGDVSLYREALSAQAVKALAAKRPPAPPKDKAFRSERPPMWVLNGGMEGAYRKDKTRSFPLHWYGAFWGKAKGRWKKDADYPHAGEAALMIECDALPTGGISFYQNARIPLIPGRTYTLSAWMRSDFDVDVGMGIHADGGGIHKQFTTTRRWEKYSLTETYAGVTSSGFVIFYYGSKRPGNLAIDDVELTIEE